MSEIQTVSLSSVDPNPMRKLAEYPFNAKKIDALRQSIRSVGLWEGVIGRKHGNRVQIAFGHHRVEAARQELGDRAKVSIIVRDLSDEEMIQFMGRENLEDYNADFLVMLESWEAAEQFLGERARQNPEVIETARLLGWTYIDGKSDHTARACSDASRLIAGGYLSRKDIAGLSVKSVSEIAARVVAQHEQIERMAKTTQRPRSEVEHTKKISGKAGAKVANAVREGRVAQRDIRGEVDVAAYRHAKDSKRQTPLFAMFGKSLADQIAKLAKSDAIAEKFQEIQSALGDISVDDDIQIVKRIALECEHASERFDKWNRTFANPKTKVVNLKGITS